MRIRKRLRQPYAGCRSRFDTEPAVSSSQPRRPIQPAGSSSRTSQPVQPAAISQTNQPSQRAGPRRSAARNGGSACGTVRSWSWNGGDAGLSYCRNARSCGDRGVWRPRNAHRARCGSHPCGECACRHLRRPASPRARTGPTTACAHRRTVRHGTGPYARSRASCGGNRIRRGNPKSSRHGFLARRSGPSSRACVPGVPNGRNALPSHGDHRDHRDRRGYPARHA